MVIPTSPLPAVAIPGSAPVPHPWSIRMGELLHGLPEWAAAHRPAVAAAAVVVAVVVVGVWVLGRAWDRRAWLGASRVAVLVPPRVDPAGAVMFWQHLLGLLRPRWSLRPAPHVVFEYQFSAAGIEIVVWVPATVAAPQIAAAVRSAWPGTRTTITPAPPPNLQQARRGLAGGRLRLARPAALPLATEHRLDPLRALIGAASPLPPSERVRVQVLARPISGARLAALTRPTRPVDLGAAVLGGLAGAMAGLAQEVVATAVHGPTHTSRSHRRAAGMGEQGPGRLVASAQDRAAATKAHGTGGGHTVAVHYLCTATPTGPGRDAVRTAQARATRRARAVGAAFAEHSGHNHLRRRHLRRPEQAIERRRLRRGDPMSVPEIAALAHLPTDDHVPGLQRAGAAAIAPPPQVPAGGAGVRPLGDSDAVPGRPVGLSVADARHHLWVLGATGAGKSTLLVHQVLADAATGRAAIVIDPKGDLVDDITTRLPDHARDRLVLLDPDQPDASGRWPCLNPLDPLGLPTDTAVGDTAVENTVSVFARVFAAGWGHRSEDLFRISCLTLRNQPGTVPGLDQIPDLLRDDTVRARVTSGIGGRLGRFWTDYDRLSPAARAQVSAPLLNKLRSVLLRPFAEHVLCGASTVDLTQVLDRGGLLLVRLPKGRLGEDTVRLTGSLLVAQIWAAALTRAARPEHTRPDASLLIDECHNFLHLPYRIEDMLAEARGFHLGLTLAHQHLTQLTPPLRDAIATNARNKIVFAVSPTDATALARHTLPELGPHDLAHLDRYHAAATLLTDNTPTRAFTLTTRPLPPPRRPPDEPNSPPPSALSARDRAAPCRAVAPDGTDRRDPRLDARPTRP